MNFFDWMKNRADENNNKIEKQIIDLLQQFEETYDLEKNDSINKHSLILLTFVGGLIRKTAKYQGYTSWNQLLALLRKTSISEGHQVVIKTHLRDKLR
jgi:hypothetical protein